jgi:hypothetical protein
VATEHRTRAARVDPRNGLGAVIAVADLAPLLDALRAATRGETGVRLDARGRGPAGQLAKAFNDLAKMREKTTDEIVRLGRLRLHHQAGRHRPAAHADAAVAMPVGDRTTVAT